MWSDPKLQNTMPIAIRKGPMEAHKGPLAFHVGPMEVHKGPMGVHMGPSINTSVDTPVDKCVGKSA